MIQNKKIILNDKEMELIPFIQKINLWLHHTFTFNAGRIDIPKPNSIKKYINVDIEDDDTEQFRGLKLTAPYYLIYIILMVGVQIGIQQEKKRIRDKKKEREEKKKNK